MDGESEEEKDRLRKTWRGETGSWSEAGSLFQRWGEAYWKQRSVIFRENASKCDIRGTSIIVSLKGHEILQVGRMTGGKNFVIKRNQFILYCTNVFGKLLSSRCSADHAMCEHVKRIA